MRPSWISSPKRSKFGGLEIFAKESVVSLPALLLHFHCHQYLCLIVIVIQFLSFHISSPFKPHTYLLWNTRYLCLKVHPTLQTEKASFPAIFSASCGELSSSLEKRWYMCIAFIEVRVFGKRGSD